MAAPEDASRIDNHVMAPPPGTYTIDPVHTFVDFTVQHLIVGRVKGHFADVSGSVHVGEHPEDLALDVTIDTASIDTKNDVRNRDLKSASYFDVERFPTMTYRSTSAAAIPGGGFLVQGDLTVKDQARPVELTVTFGGSTHDPFGNLRLGFEAEATATRTDFGLTSELINEAGNLLIRRDVRIEISAEVVRPL